MATHGPESLALANGTTVTFRHLRGEDGARVPAFAEAIAAESTHTLMYPGQPFSQDLRALYDAAAADPLTLCLGAFAAESGELVAYLSFRPERPGHPWVSHVAQFGMMVRERCWGQGIGRKLLEIQELHAIRSGITRLEATVRVANTRGVRFYEASGFEIEGRRRQAARIQGESHDEYFIAMLLPRPLEKS